MRVQIESEFVISEMQTQVATGFSLARRTEDSSEASGSLDAAFVELPRNFICVEDGRRRSMAWEVWKAFYTGPSQTNDTAERQYQDGWKEVLTTWGFAPNEGGVLSPPRGFEITTVIGGTNVRTGHADEILAAVLFAHRVELRHLWWHQDDRRRTEISGRVAAFDTAYRGGDAAAIQGLLEALENSICLDSAAMIAALWLDGSLE